MNDIKLDKRSLELRKRILQMFRQSRRGHVPSALSIVEILRVLYDDILRVDPRRPVWDERDRLILSKGHGCMALYVMLADKGFFPAQHLDKFCEFGEILGGHPEYGVVPGIEASTGSLGHGLSIGVGIALNGDRERRDYRTFVVIGDGECDEGTVWEAALSAAHHQLEKLTVLIDYNRMQCHGAVDNILKLDPLADKWRSFGFEVREVDGHSVVALREVLSDVPFVPQKPSAIICHTTKGKGIRDMENNPAWHHKSIGAEKDMNVILQELEMEA